MDAQGNLDSLLGRLTAAAGELNTGAVDDRNEAIYNSWSDSFFRVYDNFHLYDVATKY